MQLHPVTVSLNSIVVMMPNSDRVADSFEAPKGGFEIHQINDLLWRRGWSVAGPWRTADSGGQMRLTNVVLKRG